MRHLIRIVEGRDPYEEEERNPRYEALPFAAALKPLRAAIAAAAQAAYDNWDQSDPENDELNGGGICHLIADKVAGIVSDAGFPCTTVSAWDEVHVYCVAQCRDGVVSIDIPYRLYETGGGYSWTKIEDVTFTPDDVALDKLDGDPARMGQYVDEWDEGVDEP